MICIKLHEKFLTTLKVGLGGFSKKNLVFSEHFSIPDRTISDVTIRCRRPEGGGRMMHGEPLSSFYRASGAMLRRAQL